MYVSSPFCTSYLPNDTNWCININRLNSYHAARRKALEDSRIKSALEAKERATKLDARLKAVKKEQARLTKIAQNSLEELRVRLANEVAALAGARAEAAADLEGNLEVDR